MSSARILGSACCGALQLSAVVSLSAQPGSERPVSLPAPSGPFALGTVRVELVDSARREVLSPTPGARRELVVQLWYPTMSRTMQHPAAYVPDTGFYPMLRGDSDLTDEARAAYAVLRTHADSGAPVARGRRHAVLLFSHGLGVPAFYYSAFLEEIASHGYVVVAVEHPYAGGTVLRRGYVGMSTDSAMTRMRLLPENLRSGFLASRVTVQAEDFGFVTSWLVKLDRTDRHGRFYGTLDLDRLGAMGHSLGGSTAVEFCRVDPRPRACADLDGRLAWAWPTYLEGIAKPLLYLRSDDLSVATSAADSGSVEARLSAERAAFGRSRAPTYDITQRATVHMDFSDYSFVAQPREPIPTADPLRILRTFARVTLDFFTAYLSSKDPAKLTQGVSADPALVWRLFQGRSPESPPRH